MNCHWWGHVKVIKVSLIYIATPRSCKCFAVTCTAESPVQCRTMRKRYINSVI